ncbi:helix-turn-helix transcriptional regulator [Sphingobacterium sp. Mn56C]|uniref:helix-turn-helix transcriptional regulator n=1 Tax=Sphingobacterium sp. Mn56C TaxID=3395261 RepID=UPI003BD25E8C
MNDLIQYVSHAIQEYTGKETSISRRQIFKDIDFMRDTIGFNAPIIDIKEGKKAFYRYDDPTYSITLQQINPIEAELLKNALEVLKRFKGIAPFDFIAELSLKLKKTFQLEDLAHIIFFDHNEYLKNIDSLGQLLKATQDKDVLTITYQSFNQNKEDIFVFHPYFLKQYNKRWFLFGQREDFETWTNLALDRIMEFTKSYKHDYKANTQDPEAYFEDIIGVSKPIGAVCQFVKIKVNKSLWTYIESKPLHPSQKVINKADSYTTIQLDIIPNYEFYAQILGLGAAIEVLEPKQVRDAVREKIEESLKLYN